MAADLAIEARGLGKRYRTYASPGARVMAGLTGGRRGAFRDLWALSGVDLALPRGAAYGVVGANGAGKSTLLKVLSGTTAPSAGAYRTAGRVAGLLELGAGFHPDFTARENVLLNGVLLGHPRRVVASRLDAILDFAELRDVADEPVRTYSTGMAMRLGFAAALGFEPEVLILDEVFAVGDQRFQKKCADRLLAERAAGRTILFCSHSLYDVRTLCDEALWLADGRVAASGPANVVTNRYAAWQDERAADADADDDLPARWPRIARVAVHDAKGRETSEVASGDSIEVRVDWTNGGDETLQLGVGFVRQDQVLCAALGTRFDGLALEGAGGTACLSLPRLALLAGTFRVVAYLFDEHGLHRYHERGAGRDLVVNNDTDEVGLVRLDHAWALEPRATRAGTAREDAA